MSTRQAELLLAAVISARATSLLFSKILVGSLEPFNVLAVRFLIASAMLALVFRKDLAAMKPRTLLRGAAIGAAFFATMAFETHALKCASTSTVSFLENMAVCYVPLASAMLARKLPEPAVGVGCLVAAAGVGLLTLGGQTGVDTTLGVVLGLGSGVCYTAAIMLTARLSRKDDPIQLGIAQIFSIGLFALVFSVAFETPALPSTPIQWGCIAALVIVCTGFGFTLQPLAQKHLSADVAGLFCALSPLVATLLGWAFLGEQLTAARSAGMALIVVSMLIASIPWEKARSALPARLAQARASHPSSRSSR
jgi:drug/metabolite transporter (DMT)-like permease